MFTRMQGSKVVSDKGFVVAITSSGVDGLFVYYEEQGKGLFLFANLPKRLPDMLSELNGTLSVEIPRGLRWSNPNATETLTPSDEKRILMNIEDGLRFLKQPFTFVRGE